MPFICKKCMESIRKHAGKHPVIMITFDNYQEYVTVPSYILEKVGKEISYTHFRSCFEFLQKVFLGLMYPFSCVLWAIFWSFPLLFFVR